MASTKSKETDAVGALASFITDSMADAPNLQLPSPDLRDFYQEEADRIIWIRDTIEQETLQVVKKILDYNKADRDLKPEDRKPIKVYIDTPGGSVAVMWSIIQTIKISKTPVYTVNFCECLSAGAHILAAGHKRFGMPGSTVLIHSGSCMYAGTQEQADNAKKFYDSLSKKADEQLLKDTCIEAKVFKKKAPFDWYLDTDEALKNKVIDKVITDLEEIM